MADHDYVKFWEADWPMPTMSEEELRQTRGCPQSAFDCKCYGQCPVRMERIFRAQEHDRKRRDWRHR